MTLRQISAIHFDGHSEAAKKRVQRLKVAGYISERPRATNEPTIHFLTCKAFDALIQDGMLSDIPSIEWGAQEKRIRVSHFTLRHELGVMDCKAALITAIRSLAELSLVEFSTWPLRNQFKVIHSGTGNGVLVKPDGFIHMENACAVVKSLYFFLEVDYSTESLDTLAAKILCYRNRYRHGGFAKQFGYRAEEYRKFPFRTLVVCKTAERRDNLSKRLRISIPPIKTFAVLTTCEEFMSNPLKVIDQVK